MSETVLWSIISFSIPVVIGLVVWGLRALRKLALTGELEDRLITAVIDAVQRVKDKVVEEIMIAQSATSDGGKTVTAAEKSKLRDLIYSMLMVELKGPLREYAVEKGEKLLKGTIGRVLDKFLERIGIDLIPDVAKPKGPALGPVGP